MLNVDPRVAQRPKSACDHRDNKMHEIYLARSDSQELRKAFVNVDDALQTRPFNPGTEFSYERRHCRSMADVRDLLNGLADDPHCAVVLGHPLNPRGSRNSQTFEDVSTTLWWLDLDGVPELEGGTQVTIEQCLPFLAGHEYVYAFSQSAGLKEGLRCRVICETDDGLLTRQYAHARHYNALLCAFEGTKANYLDTQIYKPSHLLFTARPHLTGIDDPHPVRAFLVAGEQGPVQLDAMPELVDVTITSDCKPSDGLPALVGFGIGTGDSNHSINALTAWAASKLTWASAGRTRKNASDFGIRCLRTRARRSTSCALTATSLTDAQGTRVRPQTSAPSRHFATPTTAYHSR